MWFNGSRLPTKGTICCAKCGLRGHSYLKTWIMKLTMKQKRHQSNSREQRFYLIQSHTIMFAIKQAFWTSGWCHQSKPCENFPVSPFFIHCTITKPISPTFQPGLQSLPQVTGEISQPLWMWTVMGIMWGPEPPNKPWEKAGKGECFHWWIKVHRTKICKSWA